MLILLYFFLFPRVQSQENSSEEDDALMINFVHKVIQCESEKDPLRVHDVAFIKIDTSKQLDIYEKLLVRVSEEFSVVLPPNDETISEVTLHVVSFLVVFSESNDFVGASVVFWKEIFNF